MRNLLLFLILSFLSTSSFSSTLYNIRNVPATNSPDRISACQSAASLFSGSGAYVVDHGNYFECRYSNSSGNDDFAGIIDPTTGVCPAGYEDDGSGNCEEPQCPFGQVDIGNGCVDICFIGSKTFRLFEMGKAPESWVEPAGCTEEFSTVTDECVNDAAGILYCKIEYSATGEYTDPSTFDNTAQENATDDVGKSELPPVESTDNTVISPPVIEAKPDGTETTVTETNTKTNDMGTTVEKVNNTVVQKDSSGSTTEKVTENKFLDKNDGTAEETITETVNATPSTINETTYNVTNQTQVTNTYNSGDSGTTTTVTNNTYNTSGAVTDSAKTTTGSINPSSGNGEGTGEEGSPDFCEYASEVCSFMEWVKGDNYVAPEHAAMPYEEVNVGDLEETWSSGLGSGSCPAGETVQLMNGKSFTRDYTDACYSASNVFKPILLFIILMWSGFIIAGVRK